MIVACALAACLSVVPAPDPAPIEPVWLELAACESGEWIGAGGPFVAGSATWDTTAGPHEGGLQWEPRTWDWLRPAHYPASAADANARQEVAVAERYRQIEIDAGRGGYGPWPTCARLIGLPR